MKLTEAKLRTIIRETIKEAGFGPQPTQGGGDYFGSNLSSGNSAIKGHAKFSSREAKTIIDQSVREYAKILRKAQYKIIKDWMSKAKAGVLDYFDINRGISSGDITRAYPYETRFLRAVLNKPKIMNRFKKYYNGRRGKKR